MNFKRRAFIWGASGLGKKVFNEYKDKVDILGFVDINKDKWNTTLQGCNIYNPEILKTRDDYDIILAGTGYYEDIPNMMYDMGIPNYKLDTSYVDLFIKPRVNFLKNYAKIIGNIDGVVAEAGVFRGEFAKEINVCFPNNRLYLFDTFEGFNEKDLEIEKNYNKSVVVGNVKNTSEKLVLNKMKYKDNVTIFKGYFPETVTDEVLNQKYIFVNLDMDLYQPTLEGLRVFWDRMIDGGVILVHDYFNDVFPNVKKAISDFENEINNIIHKVPIGDQFSIALIK